MRRILLLFTVAAMMAAMMTVAGPALATVHPLAKSERSNAPKDTQGFVSAKLQDPPGLSAGEVEGIPIVQPKNPNQSSNSAKLNEDPFEGNLAQPIVVANENAFKPEG